jgi:DivIVA domain-containing protein
MSGLSSEGRSSVARQVLSRDLVLDAALVIGWFVAVGVLAAVVWWQITPLAEFTRTTTNAQMGEGELGRQVATDGWFFTIAAVGGLASGIVLLAMRRRDPIAMVILVTLGGVLASWLMVRIGLWLGPADPAHALRDVAVGGKVPMQLEPHADGVTFVWPVAALVGALGVLWGLDEKAPEVDGWQSQRASAPAQMQATSAYGASVRDLVTTAQFTPVRLREGYDMTIVDQFLDQVVEVAVRGDDVRALIDTTTLPRVRAREAYDCSEVDDLLTQIKAQASSSMTG